MSLINQKEVQGNACLDRRRIQKENYQTSLGGLNKEPRWLGV
jgi:hypothetical protein